MLIILKDIRAEQISLYQLIPKNVLTLIHLTFRYSVAWYPIYRIPDGNFRAAFLTYHSLGHMVHRSANVDSANGKACIVSPALGLQSYNAQVALIVLTVHILHWTSVLKFFESMLTHLLYFCFCGKNFARLHFNNMYSPSHVLSMN